MQGYFSSEGCTLIHPKVPIWEGHSGNKSTPLPLSRNDLTSWNRSEMSTMISDLGGILFIALVVRPVVKCVPSSSIKRLLNSIPCRVRQQTLFQAFSPPAQPRRPLTPLLFLGRRGHPLLPSRSSQSSLLLFQTFKEATTVENS